MKINRMRLLLLTMASTGLTGIGSAWAVNQSATATVGAAIKFDTPLSLTKVTDIDFGAVSTANDAWTITTAGVISHTGAGVQLYGATSKGQYTVIGSTTQLINITVGTIVNGTHTTLSALTGDYNAAGSAAFPLNGVAAPGAGKTLNIGATITAAAAVVGADNTSFNLTVIYQ